MNFKLLVFNAVFVVLGYSFGYISALRATTKKDREARKFAEKRDKELANLSDQELKRQLDHAKKIGWDHEWIALKGESDRRKRAKA